MTAIWRLQEDAAEMERAAERLTRDIDDAEARIVDLRRKRDDVRFHRAETLAAANVLDNIGFRVDRDPAGVVTVHVDPPSEPEDAAPPEAKGPVVGWRWADALRALHRHNLTYEEQAEGIRAALAAAAASEPDRA